MSGEKSLVIPFLSRDKKAGKVKIIINLIKMIASLNKVREEIKTLQEIIYFFFA